jgi:hypothetical protein
MITTSPILALLLMASFPVTTALGQFGQEIITTPFTDDTGFTVDLPQGWIANDYQNTGAEATATEDKLGYTQLAILCEAGGTAPRLGSDTATCSTSRIANTYVQIFRYKDFPNKPEIIAAGIPPSLLTGTHVYLYYLDELRHFSQVLYPNGDPSAQEPIIAEQYTLNGAMIAKEGEDVIFGDMYMINWKYNLFFLDKSTGHAYRITMVGSDIDDWISGRLLVGQQVPEAIEMITSTVRLNSAPSLVSHQLFTYEPSIQTLLDDPGAIDAIPREDLRRGGFTLGEEGSSSNIAPAPGLLPF